MQRLLIFLFLLDNDIIDHIVKQTNLYATQKHPGAHYKWQPTCNDEMKLFLGMIVAMGVHRLQNKDGSTASVPCPRAVKEYNAYMGGVDMADAKREVYSCSRRSKKWWHRMFYFLFDICIVNAHIVQCDTPHKTALTQKQF